MSQFTFCTDEDIAVRATADFTAIVPVDQLFARGTDGTIAGDGWTLSSPSANFQTLGLAAGHVVRLTAPKASFPTPGELLGVASVHPDGSVTLKRRGLDPGSGFPPGACSGVTFSVSTLMPQIRLASYDLDRRYGVNDLVVGRRSSDLFDPAELREACVLTVLFKLYLDQSRGTSEPASIATGRSDVWGSKARWVKLELDELLSRVVVHWRPATDGLGNAPSEAPTTRFSMRVSR
jgi:hypothetical protein